MCSQTRYNTGLYLFYNTVKRAAIGGIPGSHTAMKSANTVKQPYGLSEFDETEVNLPQDFFPDQAYFTFVTVRTRYLF